MDSWKYNNCLATNWSNFKSMHNSNKLFHVGNNQEIERGREGRREKGKKTSSYSSKGLLPYNSIKQCSLPVNSRCKFLQGHSCWPHKLLLQTAFARLIWSTSIYLVCINQRRSYKHIDRQTAHTHRQTRTRSFQGRALIQCPHRSD